MSEHQYPAEPAGPFPQPPRSFVDEQDRSIELRVAENQFDSLVDMYLEYEPSDHPQGVPPTNDAEIPDWIESVHEVGVDILA